MNKCTWKDCFNTGGHIQLDKNQKPWADLCDKHVAELDASIISGNPRLITSAWVKAHGGAAKMAKGIFNAGGETAR